MRDASTSVSPTTNIPRCVNVSVVSKPATPTPKHLFLPLSLLYPATRRAGEACVSWLDQNNRDAYQCGQQPHARSKVPGRVAFPPDQPLRVFQGNASARTVTHGDNLTGFAGKHLSLGTRFNRTINTAPLIHRAAVALSFQDGAQVGAFVPVAPCHSGSRANVAPEPRGRLLDFGQRDRHGHASVPLVVSSEHLGTFVQRGPRQRQGAVDCPMPFGRNIEAAITAPRGGCPSQHNPAVKALCFAWSLNLRRVNQFGFQSAGGMTGFAGALVVDVRTPVGPAYKFTKPFRAGEATLSLRYGGCAGRVRALEEGHQKSERIRLIVRGIQLQFIAESHGLHTICIANLQRDNNPPQDAQTRERPFMDLERALRLRAHGLQRLPTHSRSASDRHARAALFGHFARPRAPWHDAGSVESKILAATAGAAYVEILNPEEAREVREGTLAIPILFSNPFLLRPFEKLTTAYGVPQYHEVEPTAFLALSFLTMFGVMFGDVGQGLVLTGAGYVIFRTLSRHTDLGILLMECGISSTVFGFLYGSVFGLEDLMPPLWFHPMHDLSTALTVSLSFGAGLISVGLLLNVINSLRYQETTTAIFGERGLMGAFIYWVCLAVGTRFLLTGQLGMAGRGLLVLIGLPVLSILFHRPVEEILRHRHGDRVRWGGVLFLLVESLVDLGDTFLAYLANTVSFVRISAFALAHVGLFTAVFALAENLSGLRGGGVWYWLTLLLGNLGIIGLEGLVASIQAIRLEYYEFFGKFFKGGGEMFRPLQV